VRTYAFLINYIGLLSFFGVTFDAGCGCRLGFVLFVIGFMAVSAIVMNSFGVPLACQLVFFSLL